MKILGVDPGTRFVGYGIVERQGHQQRAINYGLINASKIKDFPSRLLFIHQSLQEIIEKEEVEGLALEEVFYGKNFKSAIKIGEARGIIILCGAQNNLPIYEYAPTIIKKAVTGNGKAHKSQVAQMVSLILGIHTAQPREDVTDALAIALCHCHRSSPAL